MKVENAKRKTQSVLKVISQVKVLSGKLSIFHSQFSIIPLLLVSLAFAGPIREGNNLYDKGDYTAALSRYAEARSGKDSLLARFNIGAGLYKQKKYAEAIQELSPLVGHSDSSLSASAAYNAACAHFRLGQAAEGGERISSWRSALGLLKRALDFSPDYIKAKQNAEVISRLLKAEVKKQQDQKGDGKQPPLSEAAKRALAKALELVRAGRYAEALSILQKAREAEPSATALDPYLQRLRDVMDIQAGKKPAAAPDASNALNELEVI